MAKLAKTVIDFSITLKSLIECLKMSDPTNYCNYEINLGSKKLPTYPSLKLTLTLTSHLGQNVGLGEG